MKKPIFWVIAAGLLLLFSLWLVGLPFGCSTATGPLTQTTNTTIPTISVPNYDREFAYVTNDYGGHITVFSIDLSTGKLTSVESISPNINGLTLSPSNLTIDPSGTFLYAMGSIYPSGPTGGSGVFIYRIDPMTGQLSPVEAVRTAPGPMISAVDPGGKYLYQPISDVSTTGADYLSSYKIDPSTGGLSFICSVEANRPISVTVHPSGRFIYLSNRLGDTVKLFGVDTASGNLTLLDTVEIKPELNFSFLRGMPGPVCIDPTGTSAYVTVSEGLTKGGAASGAVYRYLIDQTTGKLTFTEAGGAGISPFSSAFDPSGKFYYVANETPSPKGSYTVSVYTINRSSGALEFVETKETGGMPKALMVDPAGKYLYVGNFSQNPSVSVFSIDPSSGALTLVETVISGNSFVTVPLGTAAGVGAGKIVVMGVKAP